MLLSYIFAIADTRGSLPSSFVLSPALFAQMFLPRLVINLGRGQLKKKIKKKIIKMTEQVEEIANSKSGTR